MQSSLTTPRLLIEPLGLNDTDFIFQLLNTEGWIKFIGNKNIQSKEDANAYIKKITENKNYSYLVVRLKENKTELGIVTFIKREYLQHHDIGFAFLPEHAGKGYAYEAASAYLSDLLVNNKFSQLLATTLPENTSSISLIKKLGLKYKEEIKEENEILHVYEVSAEDLKHKQPI
ncbi:MAG: GNAT family N-acetyltransferase [Bacteroidia bacterium]